jgi:hypothetical protein
VCSLDYSGKCLKSLVVWAVIYEPVSALNFPFIREFNRENLDFEGHRRKATSKPAYTSAGCGGIP